MIKEVKIAIEKEHVVSIKTLDTETIVGTPQLTSIKGIIRIKNEQGITYISYNQIEHVMRVIPFQ